MAFPSQARPAFRRLRRSGRSGFTLIELMAVMTLIGIMAVIAYPQFAGSRDRAHLAAVISDFRNFAVAQEEHRHARMSYALDLADLRFEGTAGVRIEVIEAHAAGWSAVGRHAALPEDQGCAMHLGDAEAPVLPNGARHSAGRGVVECG
jgi:prepilin-type N-terminal cleavage/methylation domain-containing protein